MAKFKAKPLSVEAFIWNGYDPKTNPSWFTAAQKLAPDMEGAVRIVNDSIVKMICDGKVLEAHRGQYVVRFGIHDIRPMTVQAFELLFIPV